MFSLELSMDLQSRRALSRPWLTTIRWSFPILSPSARLVETSSNLRHRNMIQIPLAIIHGTCRGNDTRVGSPRRKEAFKTRSEPIGPQLGQARQSHGRLLPCNQPY